MSVDVQALREQLAAQVASGDVDFDRLMGRSLGSDAAAGAALDWLGARRTSVEVEAVAAVLAGAWASTRMPRRIDDALPRRFLAIVGDATLEPRAGYAAAQALARLMLAELTPALRASVGPCFSGLVEALRGGAYGEAAAELREAVEKKSAADGNASHTSAPVDATAARELAGLRELVDDHLRRGGASAGIYGAMSAGLAAIDGALTAVHERGDLSGRVIAQLREGLAQLREARRSWAARGGPGDPELAVFIERQAAFAELVEQEIARIQAGETTLV